MLNKPVLGLLAAVVSAGLVGCSERSRDSSTGERPSVKSTGKPGRDDAAVAKGSAIARDAATRRDQAIDPNAIVVGLDADMSSSSAEAGEAIWRGASLAINEINQRGGVLGRPLQLVVRDHRGNPARGVDNIAWFAELPNLAAVLGGLHTPVVLAQLDAVHARKIVFLIPWAAGTSIIENGRKPSYVFRVSVRDEFAAVVITKHAVARGCSKVGMLLERTPWGRSNRDGIASALANRRGSATIVEWFNLGTVDLTEQIQSLVASDAECIVLVANPIEGQAAIKSMAELPVQERLPIYSHWGILGAGRQLFVNLEPVLDKVELAFLQSFSFFNPKHPERAERVFKAYCREFPDCTTRRDIFSPTGTAHAYELIHLLALAMEKAGKRAFAGASKDSARIDGSAIREALESLESYRGLIRDYRPPFTAERHDALTVSDLQMCHFQDSGAIVPVSGESSKSAR